MRQRMKLIQKREYEILRRNKIRDELVLLQDLKRQQLLASLANKDKMIRLVLVWSLEAEELETCVVNSNFDNLSLDRVVETKDMRSLENR